MESNRIQHLKGTPREIGFYLGQALCGRFDKSVGLYMRERPMHPDAVNADELCSGAMDYLKSLPVRFQQEFEGMAEGAQLPLECIAEWAYFEQYLREQYMKRQSKGACSGFLCMIDGKVWVGRNNDWRVPEVWGHVIVREIEGRIPTACFGMEGDVFTGTGYNKEKLWLHLHYLPTPDSPRPSRPSLISYMFLTEALETCVSIDDLEEMLSRVDRDDATMLFVVDGKTNEGVIFECTCQQYAKREMENGCLVGTNHFLTRTEEVLEGSMSRYDRVQSLIRKLPSSKVDIQQDLIAILADDEVEQREGDWLTVYSNIACPASGEMWYTFGGHPSASKGNWQRFELPW